MSVDFKSINEGGLLITGLEGKYDGPCEFFWRNNTVFSIIFTRKSFAINSSPPHISSNTNFISFSINFDDKSGDLKKGN